MLSPFDELPVHQLPEPVTHLASSDRNAFERHRFHGGDRDGALLFGATLALYPNREIVDAALSVVLDGVQHSVHASARLAPGDRTMQVGPFSLEVVQPLQVLRVVVDGPLAAELGIAADLTFTGHGAPLEASRHTARTEAGRGPDRDTKRFSQWGAWDGHIRIDGRHHAVGPVSLGTRERSWGTQPVGEPVGGAPLLQLPQRFVAAAVGCIGDQVVDIEAVEDELGRRTHLSAHRRVASSPATEPLRDGSFTLAWAPGTRRPDGARLRIEPWNEDALDVELIPLASMALRGLGYQSPDWMHGSFKAEAAVGREQWALADLDPEDVHNVHWLSSCRVRHGGSDGLAFLEVLPLGPHAPSGLTGFTGGSGTPADATDDLEVRA